MLGFPPALVGNILGGVLKLTATAVKTNILITAAAAVYSFLVLQEKVVPLGRVGSFASRI